jgi:uncharacterized RDD family membrane protein YckC
MPGPSLASSHATSSDPGASAPGASAAELSGPRVRAAGLVRRALAAAIDGALLVGLFVVLQALASVLVGKGLPRLGQLGPGGLLDAVLGGSGVAAVGLALFALLAGGYLLLLHTGPGQTLGKRALGIRVIDGFGQPLGLGRSTLRLLALVPSAGLAGLGLLWIGFDRERRAVHDRLADTHVVRVSVDPCEGREPAEASP